MTRIFTVLCTTSGIDLLAHLQGNDTKARKMNSSSRRGSSAKYCCDTSIGVDSKLTDIVQKGEVPDLPRSLLAPRGELVDCVKKMSIVASIFNERQQTGFTFWELRKQVTRSRKALNEYNREVKKFCASIEHSHWTISQLSKASDLNCRNNQEILADMDNRIEFGMLLGQSNIDMLKQNLLVDLLLDRLDQLSPINENLEKMISHHYCNSKY